MDAVKEPTVGRFSGLFPWLRTFKDRGPVTRMLTEPDAPRVWLITGRAEVMAVLSDLRFEIVPKVSTPGQPPLTCLDADRAGDHQRLRRPINGAFTAPAVEAFRPRIQATADKLIDAVVAQGDMDLARQYAYPMAYTTMLDVLGVPRSQTQPLLSAISRFSTRAGPLSAVSASVSDVIAAKRYPPLSDTLSRMLELLAPAPNDLIDHLLELSAQDGGLGEEELTETIVMLVTEAAQVQDFIALATLVLLDHPVQLAVLRATTGLIQPAIEELLRFTSPIPAAALRIASEDVELGGQHIAKGDIVRCSLAGANRDDSALARPDELDITRRPNRHIAFGHGIHFCLGAPLVRLEGAIAIETLFRRLPALRLAVPRGKVRIYQTVSAIALGSLPVAW